MINKVYSKRLFWSKELNKFRMFSKVVEKNCEFCRGEEGSISEG